MTRRLARNTIPVPVNVPYAGTKHRLTDAQVHAVEFVENDLAPEFADNGWYSFGGTFSTGPETNGAPVAFGIKIKPGMNNDGGASITIGVDNIEIYPTSNGG